MPLSDPGIKKAKPGITPKGRVTDKPYKIGDEKGLYLLVSAAGMTVPISSAYLSPRKTQMDTRYRGCQSSQFTVTKRNDEEPYPG